jgi:hypothetical protein
MRQTHTTCMHARAHTNTPAHCAAVCWPCDIRTAKPSTAPAMLQAMQNCPSRKQHQLQHLVQPSLAAVVSESARAQDMPTHTTVSTHVASQPARLPSPKKRGSPLPAMVCWQGWVCPCQVGTCHIPVTKTAKEMCCALCCQARLARQTVGHSRQRQTHDRQQAQPKRRRQQPLHRLTGSTVHTRRRRQQAQPRKHTRAQQPQ